MKIRGSKNMAKTKVNKKSIINSSSQTEKTILWHVAFWSLAVLLFLPPFFRGLFFTTEQRKALLFAVLILGLVCLWKWLRKDYSVLSHPMDYFMLGIPVVYIISAFNSVNNGLAIDEVVKVILYFATYWIVVQLVRERKDAEKILAVIYVSAVLVAIAALMAASGLINIKDSFPLGRMASTLQYTNALATLMAAVFVIGVYLWWKHSRLDNDVLAQKTRIDKYISFFIAVSNCLLVAVLIGTKSNGGFIVFGLGILIIFGLIQGINKLLLLFHLAIIIVPAAGIIYFFLANVEAKQNTFAWLWVLAGLMVTVGLQWIYQQFTEKNIHRKNNYRARLIIGVFFALITIAVMSLLSSSEIITLIGKFKAYSLAQRVSFVEDALKMVKERPILGWGGGGWQEAYQYFQSYGYISRQVHSNYIQVAVETGLVGLAAVAGLWLSFLHSLFSVCRKELSIFNICLGVSVLIFGIHAIGDFDLSLSALSLVLYSLMAIIRNIDQGLFNVEISRAGQSNKGKTGLILVTSFGIAVFMLLIPLLTAQNYYRDALILFQKGDRSAITSMEKAVYYVPFHADYHIALSDLYRYYGMLDDSAIELDKAFIRSKYSSDILTKLSQLALQQGNYKDAVKYAEKAINMAPWQIIYYEYAGNVYKYAGLGEIKNGKPTEADLYFSAALELPQRIKSQQQKLDLKKEHVEELTLTPNINLVVGISALVRNDYNLAYDNLAKAANNDKLLGESLVWLGLMAEKQGNVNVAADYIKRARDISVNYEKLYNDLRSIVL